MEYPTLTDCLDTDFSELVKQFPDAQIAPMVQTLKGVKAAFGLKIYAPNVGMNLALVVLATPKEVTPNIYAFLDLRTGIGLVWSASDSRDTAFKLSGLFKHKGIAAIRDFAAIYPGLPSDN